MSRPTPQQLAQSLRESAIRAQEEQDQAAQIARVSALVTAQLTGAAKRAETSKPMLCPHCNEPLPESWRTDDVTSGTDEDDNVNEPDDDDENDDDDDDRYAKAKALKAKYVNRKLTVVDRILVNRGIDPFTED